MKECALNLLENQKIKKIRTADFFNIIYNITMIGKIEESLKKLKNKDKAEILQRFFKTQKGYPFKEMVNNSKQWHYRKLDEKDFITFSEQI